MILTSVVFAGALGAGTLGVVKYREEKRKKEFPWTVAAEKLGLMRHASSRFNREAVTKKKPHG